MVGAREPKERSVESRAGTGAAPQLPPTQLMQGSAQPSSPQFPHCVQISQMQAQLPPTQPFPNAYSGLQSPGPQSILWHEKPYRQQRTPQVEPGHGSVPPHSGGGIVSVRVPISQPVAVKTAALVTPVTLRTSIVLRFTWAPLSTRPIGGPGGGRPACRLAPSPGPQRVEQAVLPVLAHMA